MLSYSCRSCRKPIQATEGCAVCKPLKPVLVITGDEQPSLVDVSNAMVKDLQQQQQDYRTELASMAKVVFDEEGLNLREQVRSAQRAVANTLSKLLDAARKLLADRTKAVDMMTVKEQRDLFIAWYGDLPSATRQEFYAALSSVETELNGVNAGWKNLNADSRTRDN